MRIVLLSNLYPPYIDGGAEIIAADFAAGLERLGHEVLVLTSSYGLPRPQQEGRIWRTLSFAPIARFDPRKTLWQQVQTPYHYYRGYHSARNALTVRRLIAEINPDVLYIWAIDNIGMISLLNVLPELAERGLPIVFHLESYWLLYAQAPQTEQSRLHARWLKRALIGHLPPLTYTSMIACSATVKQRYASSGLDPERIEVIYNGIDVRFLETPPAAPSTSSTASPQEPARLLFVGRLSREKGVLTLLKALALLVREQEARGIHLDICGSGDDAYSAELHGLVRQERLEEVVSFHGRLTQERLLEYYDRAALLLVPSLWQEPFGLVIAEAMARRLPVIASNVGGPAEILRDDVNGLLVEPGDERELAQAITSLLADSVRRERLARAAYETVRERFTIEANVRRVEQHLLRAVARVQEIEASVVSSEV